MQSLITPPDLEVTERAANDSEHHAPEGEGTRGYRVGPARSGGRVAGSAPQLLYLGGVAQCLPMRGVSRATRRATVGFPASGFPRGDTVGHAKGREFDVITRYNWERLVVGQTDRE